MILLLLLLPQISVLAVVRFNEARTKGATKLPAIEIPAMMYIAVLLLLFAPIACLVLNRLLATRILMFGCAAVFAIALIWMLYAHMSGAASVIADFPFAELAATPIRVVIEILPSQWPLIVVFLCLAVAVFVAVGFALPGDLRGFAGMPAALTMLLTTILVTIANQEPLIDPILLMVAVLCCTITLRASGGNTDADSPLIVLLAGAFAFVLLLASQYAGGVWGFAFCVMACLLLIGSAPFVSVGIAIGDAPAGIGGILLGIGLPLMGSTILLRHLALGYPESAGMLLTVIGIITLFAGAARALSETHGRRVVAWQHGAQYGLFFVAAAQGGTLLATIAPLLLIISACVTVSSSFAIATLEQRSGTDDIAAQPALEPALLPGFALLIAGAAAIGMPGTLGLVVRIELFQQLTQTGQIWAGGLLLAGSTLLLISYIVPLASLWRGITQIRLFVPNLNRLVQLLPLVMISPLMVGILNPPWLGGPDLLLPTQLAMLLGIFSLFAVPLVLLRFLPSVAPAHPDEQAAGAMMPTALAESLAGIAWLAAPHAALNLGWLGLLQLSKSSAWLFAWIERRYYLAGLTIALIVVVFIFL
jgi:hypothetical protein